MTVMAPRLEYRRLRAPREHGQALIDPPLWDIGDCLADNLSLAREGDLAGRSLHQLATDARRHLIREAVRYSSGYRDVPEVHADRLILSGHQPELFHPGVWFKNFALSTLSERHSATGINLLVDNDLLHMPGIRVPAGTTTNPHIETVAFDRARDERPFEDRAIADAGTFESFAARVRKTIEPLVKNPLVDELWNYAIDARERTDNLGQCLGQARHAFEQQLGLETLEIPLSTVCESSSFHWFVADLLRNLARFRETYNSAILEYRRVHKIRSHSHPVPELGGEANGWLEAPLWMWSASDPHRRPLFVRQADGTIYLTDRHGLQFSIDADQQHRAADELVRLSRRGIRIRPRALITTMYSRLFLSDLFLHGIGGAKYDQLTDQLISRFYGVDAPSFVVLTATMHLPVLCEYIAPESLRQIDQRLRELRFHPEKHAPQSSRNEELQAEKEHWIGVNPPRGERRPRHVALERINRELQPSVEPLRQRLLQERREAHDAFRRASLLRSREYSFCLYPLETLQNCLLALLTGEG